MWIGRHRAFVAKQLGIKKLPCFVMGEESVHVACEEDTAHIVEVKTCSRTALEN